MKTDAAGNRVMLCRLLLWSGNFITVWMLKTLQPAYCKDALETKVWRFVVFQSVWVENEFFIHTQADEEAFLRCACAAPKCQDSSARFCMCERGFWDFKILRLGRTGITVLDWQPEAWFFGEKNLNKKCKILMVWGGCYCSVPDRLDQSFWSYRIVNISKF